MSCGKSARGWDPLWVEVEGRRLFARVGKGSPERAPIVVLIHGLVVSSTYMVPLLERLASRFRVYAPDLPGYGRSAKAARIPLDLPELADALAGWMDAAGIPAAALVGNSYGCNIIAEFAVRHPLRVTRAVLQGPTVDARARSLPLQLARLARNSLYESPGLGWIMAVDYARAGLRTVRATIQSAITDPIEEKLERVTAPVMILRGSRDPLVPQDWAERLTSLLPEGQLRVIPGGAHTLNYTMPLEFTRVIAPFLAS
jgi:2-hydroxy-6-oxonona-2,4-dienedioate hydrolase